MPAESSSRALCYALLSVWSALTSLGRTPTLTVRAIKRTDWRTSSTSQDCFPRPRGPPVTQPRPSAVCLWLSLYGPLEPCSRAPLQCRASWILPFFDFRFLQRPNAPTAWSAYDRYGRRNAKKFSTDIVEMTPWNGISEDALRLQAGKAGGPPGRRRVQSVCVCCTRSTSVSFPARKGQLAGRQPTEARPPSVILRLNGMPHNSISSLLGARSSPVAAAAAISLHRPASRQLLLTVVWRCGDHFRYLHDNAMGAARWRRRKH